jgi:hypothetical protein
MPPIDTHFVATIAATCGIGYLMLYCGVQKNALEWRKRKQICPSCGRDLPRCSCA